MVRLVSPHLYILPYLNLGPGRFVFQLAGIYITNYFLHQTKLPDIISETHLKGMKGNILLVRGVTGKLCFWRAAAATQGGAAEDRPGLVCRVCGAGDGAPAATDASNR